MKPFICWALHPNHSTYCQVVGRHPGDSQDNRNVVVVVVVSCCKLSWELCWFRIVGMFCLRSSERSKPILCMTCEGLFKQEKNWKEWDKWARTLLRSESSESAGELTWSSIWPIFVSNNLTAKPKFVWKFSEASLILTLKTSEVHGWIAHCPDPLEFSNLHSSCITVSFCFCMHCHFRHASSRFPPFFLVSV